MDPHDIVPASPHRIAVSPLQAAFITGLSRKTIDQAIDRGEVRSLLDSPAGSARLVGYPELVYLRLRQDVGETLSVTGKRMLYEELRRLLPDRPRLQTVEMGPMSVAVNNAVSWVRRGLARVRRTERYVTTRPDVRAGEPVVRGTRVPVHVLADLASQGAGRDELLQDYPAVTPAALDAALLYARLHPRRGPRRAALWHRSSSADA